MNQVDELLTRGVANIIPDKTILEKLLNSKKKLNIYLGIDPTATRIHLGHAVTLKKLQACADLGHNVTFLIGDFTALIGDTSDKDSERPKLTTEEIEQNFKTYKKQAEKIINFKKVSVKHNSSWLKKLTFEDIVRLTQMFSVGDFTSRELIKKRMQAGKRVGLHEVLYPVMQGYDSYHLDTDIQLGGTDQTFNMQAGRTLQNQLRNKESFVITMQFLMGIDGQKMSKTQNNAIWLDDTPEEMFTKIMRIDDKFIEEYFVLATNTPLVDIAKLPLTTDPMSCKKTLAQTIISELFDEKAAEKAHQTFQNVVQNKELPTDIATFTVSYNRAQNASIPHVAYDAGLTESVSEARRLLKQAAIELDGKKVKEITQELNNDSILKVGKKNVIQIKVEEKKE